MHLNYDYALVNFEVDFSYLDDCYAFTQFLAKFYNMNLGGSVRDIKINNILKEICEILKKLAKTEDDKGKTAIELLEDLAKEEYLKAHIFLKRIHNILAVSKL
ncbi:34293_t:CDS:2 [Gigaspora margarita]|uniref:34293_t:CDS:1 n=1 Tax=Gigaspora margarita TaxID=4874 RepID=A0ABN7UR56_GIGMA|nr:34293_t:CDS:2 [Gigaspora margarita]